MVFIVFDNQHGLIITYVAFVGSYYLSKSQVNGTVKPVYNDRLYIEIYYLWFIQ